jgi:YHS domain-containing protein
MIRFVIFTLIAIFLITLVRMFVGIVLKGFGDLVSAPKTEEQSGPRELKKDPVCGTFVPVSSEFSKVAGGETFYFCSAACRDKYKG